MNAIAMSLLPELDHESSTTLKLFDVLPEDKWDYKPHDKSMSLGGLASHIAESLSWAEETCKQDVFEMDPASYQPLKTANIAELKEAFGANLAKAKEIIAATDDAKMMGNWSMVIGGETKFSMPRIAVLRSFIFSHMYHHRGQLTVYLRLLDVPLPQVYGPTADNPEM